MAGRRSFTVKGRIETEDASSAAVKKVEGSFRRLTTFLKSKFVITLGDVTRIAKAAFDSFKESLDLKSQTNALRIQLAQQGLAFDKYIAKLNEVAQGTVSTASLIKSSSKALLLGIPADQIADLLEVARVSAIATGQTVAQAFDDIATGIGRASPMILDNLGLVVKLGPAYAEMARQLGKSTEQLTAAEQKQALLNKVLEIGKGRIAAYGDQQDTLAKALQQAGAAQDDFRIGAGKVAGVVGTTLAGVLVRAAEGAIILAKGFQQVRIQWNLWTGDMAEAVEINNSISALDKLEAKLAATSKRLFDLRDLQIDEILGAYLDELGQGGLLRALRRLLPVHGLGSRSPSPPLCCRGRRWLRERSCAVCAQACAGRRTCSARCGPPWSSRSSFQPRPASSPTCCRHFRRWRAW